MESDWWDRLNALPRQVDDTWQGGLVRLPFWVAQEPDPPFRPWAGAWVSVKHDLLSTGEPVVPDQLAPEIALEAFFEFAMDRESGGYLPGSLETKDRGLAQYLAERLGGLGVHVLHTEQVEQMDRVMIAFAESEFGPDLRPPALSAPDVDSERMRSFAEAAKLFYEAEPWRVLGDEQLIRIEAPEAPSELAYVVVMGKAGIDTGLFFFSTPKQHAMILDTNDGVSTLGELGACWFVSYSELSSHPATDADLWEDRDLPVASPEAYPMVMRVGAGDSVSRPGAAILDFIEGVLRALALARDDEIESGRITRIVGTHEGGRGYALVIQASPPGAGLDGPPSGGAQTEN